MLRAHRARGTDDRPTRRKLRLFACASIRLAKGLLEKRLRRRWSKKCNRLIHQAELSADGKMTTEDRQLLGVDLNELLASESGLATFDAGNMRHALRALRQRDAWTDVFRSLDGPYWM